jgi:hypothetical protein
MSRANLVKECERLGLRLTCNQTRTELIERILAAQGLDDSIWKG